MSIDTKVQILEMKSKGYSLGKNSKQASKQANHEVE